MVRAKIYRSENELNNIQKEIQNVFDNIYEFNQEIDGELIACKAEDSSNNQTVYLLGNYKENCIMILSCLAPENSDYLLDCCIRMLLNSFFSNIYSETILNVPNMETMLLKVCKQIGFKVLEYTINYTKISIDKQQFYKNIC